MSQWMANRTPTDVDVRRELESVFSLLHYPLEGLPSAFAAALERPNGDWRGVYLGLDSTYDRQNVVAIFASSAGKSHLVTVTNSVPRIDLHYEILPQLAWDDFRFFLYGFRPGKSQLRLSVVLYSFDGQNLKPLWESLDIYDGKIEFQKDQVTHPSPE